MNLLLSLVIVLKFALLVLAAPDRSPWKTCACGELGASARVVGGHEAKPHSFPWMAALTGFRSESEPYCGATIISSRYLVTASHCFETADENWNWDNIRVNVGAHSIKAKDYKQLKPKSYKLYEGYTDENDINAPIFDIALIELEEDLEIDDNVMPICIHSKNFNYLINDLKDHREKNMIRSVSSLESRSEIGGNKTNLRPSLKWLQFDQPTDQSPIILDHPDKQLIRQVVKMGEIYHEQIRNDPVKIFDPAKEFTEDKLTVCGWGMTDAHDGTSLSDVLMEADISQKKSEVCENSYGDDVFFRSKMICANDPEIDSCGGDSGGPLQVRADDRMNLYGVISYGRVCGSISSPGVYTRLSAFLEWVVLHTIENSRFCPN